MRNGQHVGIENIECVVVVMFENRSFDNLLGWLYDAANPPKFNIPANPHSPSKRTGGAAPWGQNGTRIRKGPRVEDSEQCHPGPTGISP